MENEGVEVPLFADFITNTLDDELIPIYGITGKIHIYHGFYLYTPNWLMNEWPRIKEVVKERFGLADNIYI